MVALAWNTVGANKYEVGVDRGVVYPQVEGKYETGAEAWNGLTNVTQQPSGAEITPIYADNIKYANLISNEEFAATIECYTFPEAFAVCNGFKELVPGVSLGQQPRTPFGFTYRSLIGNETEGQAHGYKIHLIYGCIASPSEVSHATIGDNTDPSTMSFEVSTTPVAVQGFKPTAHLEIDSTKVDAEKLAALEAVLYGSADKEARLPLPDEVKTLLTA